ncbi:hypothetical protein [Aeromonas bivalvium]|uniref:hypothetical protein n=1 Tax=Aeromonas bivalvium TaxID=440079 RepID=UPI0038D24AB6
MQLVQIVQALPDAYDRKDMAAWLATYADDAALVSRHGDGNVVIDHDRVTRNFPEWPGTKAIPCIYLIEQGLIARAASSCLTSGLLPADGNTARLPVCRADHRLDGGALSVAAPLSAWHRPWGMDW